MLNNFYVLSPCLPYLDLLLLLYYETISYTGCIVWPRQVNRMTVWRINVKGEPPPQFTWWKDGQYSTFTFSRYSELCQLFHFHFLKIFRALSVVHFHFLKISRVFSVVHSHFLKISTLSICRSQDWDERRVPGGDAGVPRWRHCHLADPQNPGELSLFCKTIWNGTINKKDSHTLLAILPTAKSTKIQHENYDEVTSGLMFGLRYQKRVNLVCENQKRLKLSLCPDVWRGHLHTEGGEQERQRQGVYISLDRADDITTWPWSCHDDATTQVDLDLVVLETGHDVDCELLKAGNLECRCAQSFRWT